MPNKCQIVVLLWTLDVLYFHIKIPLLKNVVFFFFGLNKPLIFQCIWGSKKKKEKDTIFTSLMLRHDTVSIGGEVVNMNQRKAEDSGIN